jgi:hypothetical protein
MDRRHHRQLASRPRSFANERLWLIETNQTLNLGAFRFDDNQSIRTRLRLAKVKVAILY